MTAADHEPVADAERRLLAAGLAGELPPGPPRPKRKLRLRKVEDRVARTWVSAGCGGEVVQWRLKER